VLDLGFNLARRHFRLLLALYAWGAVPSYAVGGVLAALFVALASTVPSGSEPSPAIIGSFVVLGLVAVVAGIGISLLLTVASAAVAIACYRLIAPTGEPNELTTGSLYRAGLSRLGAMVLWFLVIMAMTVVAGWLLVLIFPLGIYVLVRLSMSWNALVLEPIGPIASLGRSWSLARGSWWHTAIVLLAASIVIGFLSYAVGLLGQLITAPISFASNTTWLPALANSIFNSAASLLLGPFSIAISVVLYFELRARAEGFDIEQRARMVTSTE